MISPFNVTFSPLMSGASSAAADLTKSKAMQNDTESNTRINIPSLKRPAGCWQLFLLRQIQCRANNLGERRRFTFAPVMQENVAGRLFNHVMVNRNDVDAA